MEDPSRGTRFQDLLDLHYGDLIAVLGDDRKNAAVFLGRQDHGVTFHQRRSPGLLHDHVLSRFEGGNGGFRMDGRRQTDGDQIDVVAQKDSPKIFADERARVFELEKKYSNVHVVQPVALGGSLGYYGGEDMDEKSSMMAHSDVLVTV